MKKSRIARPIAAVESPTVRSLPLVELLVDTKAELFELMVRSGLRVLDVMLEEDRAALCGPRYAHLSERTASRAGTVPSEVVLGGRKVAVQRPRVRAEGREVPLPTFQALAQADPLNRRVVDQMLVGVATRQYARSLEPLPAGVVSRGTSRAASADGSWPKRRRSCGRGKPRRSTASTSWRSSWTASTSANTASSSPSGSRRTARNTPWACGKGLPRTRPCVRACSPISRAAGCGRTAASS